MADLREAAPTADASTARLVPNGADRFGAERGLGVSTIQFKVAGPESPGLLVLENTFHAKGGPARHLHVAQDEWFHAIEGTFDLEVGELRHRLGPGDSVFAPRGLPHAWAHVGEGRGRMLIAFAPAGDMEAFFRKVTARDAMPPMDPELWRAHGMELVGPPLAVD